MIRSQMLLSVDYERSHCTILHSDPCQCVMETRARPYIGDGASDF